MTPAVNGAALPAERSSVQPPAPPPSSGAPLQEALLQLTELLHATASILGDIRRSEAAAGGREMAQHPTDTATAVPVINFETPTMLGDTFAGGCSGRWEPPSSVSPADGRALHIQQRLPELKAYSAAGGNSAAFERQFVSHIETSGWSVAEGFRVLPAMLDYNALAAFLTVSWAKRATLTDALCQMRLIYGPPSQACHRFDVRTKMAWESALGYHSALLAMAGVAYPHMDQNAMDSLVLQKLLSWARLLRVAMPAADDDDFTSLHAARCI
ncbi:unnamed protein product [Lampetra planeri]